MLDVDTRPTMRGRRTECDALDRLVATVHAGESGVSGESTTPGRSWLRHLQLHPGPPCQEWPSW